MCDTIGIIKSDRTLFGKNSDRSPNESQVIEFIPRHKTVSDNVKLTYIEIEEVKEVYSILISRPSWIWGAEMGVNEYGVCIGNEALFTKKVCKKKSLIGMDLVRLGLERSKTALEAVNVIKDLIIKYGQGGNCGFEHEFLYNNSFLIMDKKELYIVETEMNQFKIIKKDKATISNCLSEKDNNIKENKIVTYFSKARKRQKQTYSEIEEAKTVKDIFKILRKHNMQDNKVFCKGSVSSPCMHAGGLVGDHTTSSFAVELINDDINVWFTGTSCPCVSVFKYWKFGEKVEYPICNNEINNKYWIEKENTFRKLIGYKIPNEFYELRDELEEKIYNNKNLISMEEILEEENKLFNKLKNMRFSKKYISVRFKKYWQNKTKILKDIEGKNDNKNY